ncbi:MAG: CocE/NonD family hydrolase [Alphaproteobacteria bacterium]
MSGSTDGDTEIVRDFPHDIRIEPDLRIPMSDGRILSARLWLPVSADETPVPAVIEYDPYRHRDASYPRDALIHPWFAGHGFASIRLQPAGAGDSTGAPMDEYVRQEQDDCIEALAWIANRRWCSGKTGLYGLSWGANAALQVAARRPPSLKAIIPVHGTDNRFTDDIHYKNGCLLTAGLAWGATFRLYAQRPPDPESFGAGWRAEWLDRLDAAPDVLQTWLSHQTLDEYWRHGSVSENYGAIEAATLIVAGWADDYRNAALRLAAGLTCPHDLLAGPWGHEYPHLAGTKPRAGFLQIATDWWNRWLRDDAPATDADGMARLYLEDPAPAATRGKARDGCWKSLPISGLSALPEKRLYLSGAAEPVTVCTPLCAAIAADQWLTQGRGNGNVIDPRDLETGAAVFDLPVLEAPLEVFGQPSLTVTLTSDCPAGHLIVRLSSVLPDNDIQPLTMGLLNLRFRGGFDAPLDMPVDEPISVTVPLDALAHRLPAGGRLRLSISTRAWPLVWPEAVPATVTLLPSAGVLSLPYLPAGLAADAPDPPDASIPPPAGLTWIRPDSLSLDIVQDDGGDRAARTQTRDHGAFRIEETGMETSMTETQTFTSTENDALSAQAVFANTIRFARNGWSAKIESEVVVSADAGAFRVRSFVRAFEADRPVHADTAEIAVKRV